MGEAGNNGGRERQGSCRGLLWILRCCIGTTTAVSPGQKQVTKELAQYDGVRAVGPLAEALTWKDKSIRIIAEAALIRLLPRIQASDADCLNEKQRKCLHQALYCKNEPLVLAILTALEQVGDEKAMPYVEKLAAGRTRSSWEKRIQAAAEVCLPYLKQRVEEARSRQTLLRAAPATFVLAHPQRPELTDVDRLGE
jgi:hypothetical protein